MQITAFYVRNYVCGALLCADSAALAECIIYCKCPVRIFLYCHVRAVHPAYSALYAFFLVYYWNEGAPAACFVLYAAPRLINNCANKQFIFALYFFILHFPSSVHWL